MTASRDKPVSDWPDAEILESLRYNAPIMAYWMNDLEVERDRRQRRRIARWTASLLRT